MKNVCLKGNRDFYFFGDAENSTEMPARSDRISPHFITYRVLPAAARPRDEALWTRNAVVYFPFLDANPAHCVYDGTAALFPWLYLEHTALDAQRRRWRYDNSEQEVEEEEDEEKEKEAHSAVMTWQRRKLENQVFPLKHFIVPRSEWPLNSGGLRFCKKKIIIIIY